MSNSLPEVTTTRLYDQVSHIDPYGVADNHTGVVVLLEHLPPNNPRMTKASINSIYEGENPVFLERGSWQPAHATVVDSSPVAKVEVHTPYMRSAEQQAALAATVGQSAIFLHRNTTEISTKQEVFASTEHQTTERM